MWSQIAGIPLPFLIFAAFALGSFVCASIITADDSPIKINKNIESKIHHTRKEVSKSIPAFINCKNKLSLELDKLFGRNEKYNHNNSMIRSTSTLDFESRQAVGQHYTTPPTSLQELRRRFGTSTTIWGDWSPQETRLFYKQQLPRALQIDGALGLTLEQRAEIASANRHALRMYARERCHLPQRVLARLYDGIRHLYVFGTWNSDGMTWEEVKAKYSAEALKLGYDTDEDVLLYVHKRIVDKSSATNMIFDNIALSAPGSLDANAILFLAIKSILASPQIRSSRSLWSNGSPSSSSSPRSKRARLRRSSRTPQFYFKVSSFKTINSILPHLL